MKTAAIFVVLFAATVAMKLEESPPVEAKPLEQSTGRCLEYGVNYANHNIEIITGIQHWQDCAYRCRDHRSCSYWSWSMTRSDHSCYLKTSNVDWQYDGQAISGSYTCVSEC